jgi:hypothetical protein
MPSAIHFGFLRPGIRGGRGVPGDSAADRVFEFRVFSDVLVVRDSMLIVIVASPSALQAVVSHREDPVATMLARAEPRPTIELIPITERKIVGSWALVATTTTPLVMETVPWTPG